MTNGRTDGRTDGRTVGRTDGRSDGRTDGRTVGRTDGRTDGRTVGRTVGRKDPRGFSSPNSGNEYGSTAKVKLHRQSFIAKGIDSSPKGVTSTPKLWFHAKVF